MNNEDIMSIPFGSTLVGAAYLSAFRCPRDAIFKHRTKAFIPFPKPLR